VEALKEYRSLIVNLASPLLILTDHSNLTSFASKQILNRRQARWAIKLSELDFKIVYRPGTKNQRADALTRRSGDLPTREGRLPPTTILTPKKFKISTLISTRYLIARLEPSLASNIRLVLDKDTLR